MYRDKIKKEQLHTNHFPVNTTKEHRSGSFQLVEIETCFQKRSEENIPRALHSYTHIHSSW